MARTLTAAAVRTIKPTGQRQEIRDGGAVGLYCIVQASGHKSFALRFRKPDGRPAKLVLGPFDPSGEGEGEPVIGQPLTLAAARHLAADINRERARGRDVVSDRKAEKIRMQVQHRERTSNSFSNAVRDFIEDHARPKTRGWKRTARLLGLTPDGEVIRFGLAERWADKPVTDIDSHDIYAAVEEARTRGVPGLIAKADRPSEPRARQLFSCLVLSVFVGPSPTTC